VKGNTFSLKFKTIEEKVIKERTGSKTTLKTSEKTSNQPWYQFSVHSTSTDNNLNVQKYLIDHNESLPLDIKHAENQTDEFIPRPFVEYIPAKTGVDIETQVEITDLPLLFRFDEEVKPLLEILVTKTIEQAVFEIEREEELLSIYHQTVAYQNEQQTERDTIRMMELQFAQDQILKAKEIQERAVVVEAQQVLDRKAASYMFATQICCSMDEDIITELLSREWRPLVTSQAEAFLVEVYTQVKIQYTHREEGKRTLRGINCLLLGFMMYYMHVIILCTVCIELVEDANMLPDNYVYLDI
jgi:hypothetical protein